jgi:hypothetical protein
MAAKKKKKPRAPRSLVVLDMIKRGATNGGRMRHRNDRRLKDAGRDETRNPAE